MRKAFSSFLVLVMVCLFCTSMVFAKEDKESSGSSAVALTEVGVQQGSVSLTQNGAAIPRSFPIPAQANYVNMPSEFNNNSIDGNFVLAKNMLLFNQAYTKAQLVAMLGDNAPKFYNKTYVSNFSSWGGLRELKDVKAEETVTFIYEVKDMKLNQVGKDVAMVQDGITDSYTLLAEIGLKALTIPGVKYVYLTGEGLQKMTITSAWGVSLGYTYAYISEGAGTASAGTSNIGVGYSSGKAGRVGNPWLQASFCILK